MGDMDCGVRHQKTASARGSPLESSLLSGDRERRFAFLVPVANAFLWPMRRRRERTQDEARKLL